MHKIATSQPTKLYFTYPNTVAVICVKEKERTFLMPAVWQLPLSYKPMLFGVLVSPKRFTYQKLLSAKDFTLNYFDHRHADLVTKLGSSSGAQLDKVDAFGVQLRQAATVTAPILEDAFVSIECRMGERKTYGDHDLFVGEASQVWYDPEVIDNGNVRTDHAEPLLYLGNFTYTTYDKAEIHPCDGYQS